MLNFCSKVKKVFKIARNVKYYSKFKKVPKKCPAQKSGNAYFLDNINIHNTSGELRYLNTNQYFEPGLQSQRILEMRYRKNLAKL